MFQHGLIRWQIYPVPSLWKPKGFITRATLPSHYDRVFPNHTRYAAQFFRMHSNPLVSWWETWQQVNSHFTNPKDSHFDRYVTDSSLQQDFEGSIVKRILTGKEPMIPTLVHQKLWAKILEANDAHRLDNANDKDVWRLLVHFNRPLLHRYLTASHYQGLQSLGLLQDEAPKLEQVEKILYSNAGWKVCEASEEMTPEAYFQHLARKEFPIVTRLRPLQALFCGFEPDYWHETVGHIAILGNPQYSRFYQWCGRLAQEHAGRNVAQDLYKLLWILLEYGLIRDEGEIKVFGAAFASSHLALQRLQKGFISVKPFAPKDVLKSGMADDGGKRKKRLQFFCVESLNEVQIQLEKWLQKA
jgi:phenylalanine-4-hydroxylase